MSITTGPSTGNSCPTAPLKNFDKGSIRVAIWEKISKDSNRKFYSIKVSRRFQNNDDEWKDSSYFYASELKIVQQQVKKANKFLDKKIRKQSNKVDSKEEMNGSTDF